MKLTRYVCTHCGRRFEAEEKEILECPGCFWSTSVKKEEEAGAAAAAESSSARTSAPDKKISFRPLIKPLGILVAVLAFGGIVFAFLQKRPISEIQIPKAQDPESKQPETQTPTAPYVMTPEDQNVLARRIQLSADRALLPDEERILKNRAPFKTGINEKLPSQPWTLENFKQMVEEQERFYKVPLPRSYKKKLENLFKTKYVAASEAFKNGDLMQARNLWVESLAFPVYANNIQKHKGVALTMIRPFITDTLSKIGAINGVLVEKKIREKEQAVTKSYADILDLLEKKDWQNASAELSKLQQELAGFAQPAQLAGSVPPYPATINQVDSDIQATLIGQLQLPPPAIADLGPLQKDVDAKKRIVDSLLAENLESLQMTYDEALDLIQQKKWKEAEAKLKQIRSPLPLAEDAREKLEVLKKAQLNESSGMPIHDSKETR